MTELGGAEIGIALFVFVLPMLAFFVFYGYCTGRMFQKAGRQLWEGFIPFYNWFVWIEIVGRPT